MSDVSTANMSKYEAMMAAHVKRVVDAAPPLTDTQRSNIQGLLRDPRHTAPESGAVIAQRAAKTAKAKQCALYRHWDADGTLLYIGIAESLGNRTRGHSAQSDWTRFAKRAEAEWFPDRKHAADAETRAIIRECPLFNRRDATPDTPERRTRYLIEREAWDLLTS